MADVIHDADTPLAKELSTLELGCDENENDSGDSTEAEQRSAGTPVAFNECQGTVAVNETNDPELPCCEEKMEPLERSDGEGKENWDGERKEVSTGCHETVHTGESNDASSSTPPCIEDARTHRHTVASEDDCSGSTTKKFVCPQSNPMATAAADSRAAAEGRVGETIHTGEATSTAEVTSAGEAAATTTGTTAATTIATTTATTTGTTIVTATGTTVATARGATATATTTTATANTTTATTIATSAGGKVSVDSSTSCINPSQNERPKPPKDCCICGAPPKALDHSCVLCLATTCSACVISLKHLACPWCQDTSRNARSLRNEAAAIRAMNTATRWFSIAKTAVRGVADNVVERTITKNVEAEKENERWRKAYEDNYAVDYAGFGLPSEKKST